ncbi:TPA: hypothetical protein NOE00_002124 [Pseudomonas aeruginosa]|nr:hypothetical protein [Pseudomonas aeruginosa]
MSTVKKIGVAGVALAASVLLLADAADRLASAQVLTHFPLGLRLLRGPCRAEQPMFGETLCREVARADTARFLSGKTGPTEYVNVQDLPFIPASFDEETEPPSMEEVRP